MLINKKQLFLNLINLFFFIINPFFTTVFIIITAFLYKNKNFIKRVIINISAFYGLLNSTKVFEGDLIAYHNYFIYASKMQLSDFLNLFKADYLYYVTNYFLNHLLFHSWEMYIFLITFFSFYLIFQSSMIVVLRLNNITNFDLLIGILIVAFFYPFFSLSAHLVRNFITAAIILYFVVNYFFNKKNLWFLILIAYFIHASAIIGIISYFIPKKINFISIVKMFIIILILCISVLFVIDFYGFIIIRDLYLYQRIINFNSFSINLNIYYILIIFLVLIFIIMFIKIGIIKAINEEFLRYALFVLLILFIGMTLSSISVIKGRILLYMYFLSIPIYLIIFLKPFILFRVFNLLVLFIFFILFVKNLVYGQWHYLQLKYILINNVFNYLIPNLGV